MLKKTKKLLVISGVGLVIAGLGILALLSSMGHLPGLVSLLHAGSISSKIMLISGASAIAVGAVATATHLIMPGSIKYARASVIHS